MVTTGQNVLVLGQIQTASPCAFRSTPQNSEHAFSTGKYNLLHGSPQAHSVGIAGTTSVWEVEGSVTHTGTGLVMAKRGWRGLHVGR